MGFMSTVVVSNLRDFLPLDIPNLSSAEVPGLSKGAEGARLPIDLPINAIVSFEFISAIIPSITLLEPLPDRVLGPAGSRPGILILPTELLLLPLKLGNVSFLPPPAALPPPLAEKSSSSSNASLSDEPRFLKLPRLTRIRPMMRSETEEPPMEKAEIVMASSSLFLPLRRNIRDMVGLVGFSQFLFWVPSWLGAWGL